MTIIDLPLWVGPRYLALAEGRFDCAWHEWPWETDPSYRTIVKLCLPYEGEWLVQREPNLRVHPVGGRSVPWHTDAEFGHLADELNVWVPLTECTADSERLWVADKKPGDTQWTERPVKVEVGQGFRFPGATTRHGVVTNTTLSPRLSMDFRILAKSRYRDEGKKSVVHGVPLRLGDYWREL